MYPSRQKSVKQLLSIVCRLATLSASLRPVVWLQMITRMPHAAMPANCFDSLEASAFRTMCYMWNVEKRRVLVEKRLAKCDVIQQSLTRYSASIPVQLSCVASTAIDRRAVKHQLGERAWPNDKSDGRFRPLRSVRLFD